MSRGRPSRAYGSETCVGDEAVKMVELCPEKKNWALFCKSAFKQRRKELCLRYKTGRSVKLDCGSGD